MAATRAYVRGSGGKFAGAGAKGTKVTYGRAGGFANAAFRSRVAASRKAGGTGARGSNKGKGKKFLNTRERRQVLAGLATSGVGIGLAGVSSSRGGVGGVITGMALASIGGRVTGAGLGNATGRAINRRASARRATIRAARPKNPAGSKVRR